MMRLSQLRYIQSAYEVAQFRNPDTLAGDLLSWLERRVCDLRGSMMLSRLRAQPFYYYVLARTLYYDAVFVDAIYRDFGYIINIGCGGDTRAYRFAHLLKQNGLRVLECDQPEAIRSKQEIAAQLWRIDHVDYQPIDLNGTSWLELAAWLAEHGDAKALVMLEGVSPYVDEVAFGGFLDFLADRLPPGSHVAYDFKVQGFVEDFGRSDTVRCPFRLPSLGREIIAYHEARQFHVEHIELSAELSQRLLPELAMAGLSLFREDGLVRLTPIRKRA